MIRGKPDQWVLLVEIYLYAMLLLEIKAQGTKGDRCDGALFQFCDPSEFRSDLGWQPQKNAGATACGASPFACIFCHDLFRSLMIKSALGCSTGQATRFGSGLDIEEANSKVSIL